MGTTAQKGGKKNRKIGKNMDYCKLYTAAGLEEKNQKRRMRRHLLSNPQDQNAIVSYEKVYGKASEVRVMVHGKATNRTVNARGKRLLRNYADDARTQKLAEARATRRQTRRLVGKREAERQSSLVLSTSTHTSAQ